MLKLVKSSVALSALMAVSFMSPAMAQNASEMAVRMQQLEEQVRQLSGQVEELAFEVKKLRTQKQTGALDMPQATAPATQQKRLAEASAAHPFRTPAAGHRNHRAATTRRILLRCSRRLRRCPLEEPRSSTRRRARSNVLGAMDNSSARAERRRLPGQGPGSPLAAGTGGRFLRAAEQSGSRSAARRRQRCH